MENEERDRRKQNCKAIGDLLASLTKKDRDEFEVYTYSELIAETIAELTAEQLRVEKPVGVDHLQATRERIAEAAKQILTTGQL